MGISIRQLYPVILGIKRDISDEYRAFEGDEIPGIQVTVGFDHETGDWGFQTGDNSFVGSAYHYPIWGVAGVYRTSNCREVAREIIEEIREQEL
jgi:hypothetical protein